MQEDDDPRHLVEPFEESVSGSEHGIVPVVEGIDQAVEVERETAHAPEVHVVRLEQDDEETKDGTEERQLNVADPQRDGLELRRRDEDDFLDGWNDGALLDDEFKIRRSDRTREARDDDGRDSREVIHRRCARSGVVAVSVRVVRFRVDRANLHRGDSEPERRERKPLEERESSSEHENGAESGDESLACATKSVSGNECSREGT